MGNAPASHCTTGSLGLVGVVAYALTGCVGAVGSEGSSASELDPECAAEEASVSVGGGDTTYEPLSDGDPAMIVHGPQGGWHLLASARVRNTLNRVTITYTAKVLPEETPISWNQYGVQLQEQGSCTGDYPGMYAYLDVSDLAEGEADTPPELLEGKEIQLRLQVEDEDGRAAEASVTVIGALDPADAVADTGG